MKGNLYRITVESLDENTQQPVAGASLSFNALCHDDILAIVERSRNRGGLSADESAAMAVGLKLLGEVALRHRNEALFEELGPQLGAFIQKLKRGGAETQA